MLAPMHSITSRVIVSALAICTAGALAAQQKGSTPPPIDFVKVWNDGPASFDDLEGKVVILDFGATW